MNISRFVVRLAFNTKSLEKKKNTGLANQKKEGAEAHKCTQRQERWPRKREIKIHEGQNISFHRRVRCWCDMSLTAHVRGHRAEHFTYWLIVSTSFSWLRRHRNGCPKYARLSLQYFDDTFNTYDTVLGIYKLLKSLGDIVPTLFKEVIYVVPWVNGWGSSMSWVWT